MSGVEEHCTSTQEHSWSLYHVLAKHFQRCWVFLSRVEKGLMEEVHAYSIENCVQSRSVMTDVCMYFLSGPNGYMGNRRQKGWWCVGVSLDMQYTLMLAEIVQGIVMATLWGFCTSATYLFSDRRDRPLLCVSPRPHDPRYNVISLAKHN